MAKSAGNAIVNLESIPKISKTATVATKVLSTAGNMLLFTAITKGLELAVKGIDNLTHSAEHCKERANNLMPSYKSSLNTANDNAKTIEGLAERYRELSKGVDNLGRRMVFTTI